MQAAAYARWLGGTQTLRLAAPPAITGVAYPLQGYSEPEPVVFSNRVVVRFTDRSAAATGFALAGHAFGLEWAGFVERTRRDHDHFSVRREDAPIDRWRATGWRTGGAAATRLLHLGLHAHVEADYERLDGDAFRADLEGSIFRAAESLLRVAAELRYAPGATPWHAALRFELPRAGHVRSDFLAETASDIITWTPALAASVAVDATTRTTLAAGTAVAWHSATALVPNPETLGFVYNRIFGPELAVNAMQANLLAGSLGLRRRVGIDSALLLEGAYQRVTPARGASGAPPLAPQRTRTVWRVSVAVILEG